MKPSPTARSTAPAHGHAAPVRWRRTLGVTAAVTSLAAAVGTAQLVTGTFTPPVSDLDPLGLDSWVLPGLWLAATVAVPCGVTAVLSWRGSAQLGTAAAVSGGLLAVELLVQVPFVGRDPLQAVMGYVALLLLVLGLDSRGIGRRRPTGRAGG